ncbi:hypothetical protein EZV62_017476 [Acer yangbiense]|uniref:Sieve element occlusion N-terminal domain-containing protein n=1 Tax=Acer yangbiense TaxID=1000413 RepID=A0A5C7HGD7_9ROSI|nr:hypothetical protein EZV62_017476 [Acer yangbiense]
MEVSIVPQKMRQLRQDCHMFATSDDNVMLKQVEATHAHDGRQFVVKPLLDIIEDIFHSASPSVPGFGSTQTQLDLLDDKAFQSGFFDMLDLLASTINKVSCQISCKCSGGGDAHATTLGILNTPASYTWDAKVVLAMAAFALNYGEFWVVAQLYPTNPLAKSVALLKQLPEILERADTLKSKFEELSNLIKAMLDVAKCILEFKDLPSQYLTPDTPEMVSATAHIPTAVYWTIWSIVACAAQIMGLVGMGHEYIVSTAEAWELSSLAHMVNSIHAHLKNQLNLYYKIIEPYNDRVPVRGGVDACPGLDSPMDRRKAATVRDSTEDDALVLNSPPFNSSMVDPAVIRYIKEFWHFEKKTIIVVLDLQGKVVNTNALYMMWIWGSLAFPFTSSREEALWREESWRLELLADSIDLAIPAWMLYVGKSNPKERVRRNMVNIEVENLSHTLQDISLIWFFWVRLESMLHSKMKYEKSPENDLIMKEIMAILSYDGSNKGRAVICRGSEMAKSKGDIILKCFVDYEK